MISGLDLIKYLLVETQKWFSIKFQCTNKSMSPCWAALCFPTWVWVLMGFSNICFVGKVSSPALQALLPKGLGDQGIWVLEGRNQGIVLSLFTSLWDYWVLEVRSPPWLGQLDFFNGRSSLVAQMVKNLPAMQETWVQSLDGEDPLEEEIATHSSILAWRIPGTEEPGGQSPWGHGVGHNWVTNIHSTSQQSAGSSRPVWRDQGRLLQIKDCCIWKVNVMTAVEQIPGCPSSSPKEQRNPLFLHHQHTKSQSL